MATTLGPNTSLHYTANGNFVNGVYTPAADGFNLADVGSADMLNYLPTGVKGLVYVGMTDGVTAAFKALVDACKGNPNLYGFYLADEPGASPTIAANLMAEADYIHANLPGAKTFMVEQNLSSNTSPTYYYTPANTHIDLFGLDPYPVQTNVPNNLDYNIIPLAVAEAEKVGIPLADIVPVYQAFGGGSYSTWILPTATQEQQILATWASVVPTPAFDYAYSWGTQSGDTALSNDPALQAVFAVHNAGGTTATPPAAPTITSPAANSTDTTTATPQISGGGVTGDTVTVSIDGTVAGAATVASGAWTFTPSSALSNGSHAITATQAAAGGPSSAAASDSFTVNIATPLAAPTLTIADTTLSVDGGGGTVDLGIGVTAPASATDVTVTMTGLRKYETISDGLGDTFQGKSITLTEAQVASGLTLTSNYIGGRNPVTTLSIMASDMMDGVTSSSAAQTMTVVDPGTSSSHHHARELALLSQYMAGDTSGGSSGALQTANASTESDRSSFLLSVLRH
jgi:Bacterial Ig-like domain